MISTMTSLPGPRLPRSRTPGGLARPELLASTDWLAEGLGRPDVRVLDVRWRPDGSSRDVWAAGHIPGAVHVDWRADLTDPSDTGDTLLLAGPEQVARTLSVAGVGPFGRSKRASSWSPDRASLGRERARLTCMRATFRLSR